MMIGIIKLIFVFVLLFTICPHGISSNTITLCDYSESKDASKSKGRRGAKSSETAAKVALMKLKLHAAGDKGLPQVKSTVSLLYCIHHHICMTTAIYIVLCPIAFPVRKNLFSGISSERIQRHQPAHVLLFQVECRKSSRLCSLSSEHQEQQQCPDSQGNNKSINEYHNKNLFSTFWVILCYLLLSMLHSRSYVCATLVQVRLSAWTKPSSLCCRVQKLLCIMEVT